jgi:hypothetical protein
MNKEKPLAMICIVEHLCGKPDERTAKATEPAQGQPQGWDSRLADPAANSSRNGRACAWGPPPAQHAIAVPARSSGSSRERKQRERAVACLPLNNYAHDPFYKGPGSECTCEQAETRER